MSHALIIGYGNPWRGDDGIGWQALSELSFPDESARIRLLTTHQLAPEYADALSRVDRVLFIDAAITGAAGELRARRLEPSEDAPPPLDHTYSPARLLALTRQVYGCFPEATLFTVTGSCFDIGQSLSEPVREALALLRSRIVEWAMGARNDFPEALSGGLHA